MSGGGKGEKEWDTHFLTIFIYVSHIYENSFDQSNMKPFK